MLQSFTIILARKIFYCVGIVFVSVILELSRCGLCLVVIWMIKEVDMSQIQKLVKALDPRLCETVSVLSRTCNRAWHHIGK